MIQQQLEKKEHLKNLRKVNFGEALNSDVAKNFIKTVYQDEARMPVDEELEGTLLGLIEDVKRKHIIKVEVPSHEGHDDIYSAISRAYYLCRAYTEKNQAIIEHMLGDDFAKTFLEKKIIRVGGISRMNSNRALRRMVSSLTGGGARPARGSRR